MNEKNLKEQTVQGHKHTSRGPNASHAQTTNAPSQEWRSSSLRLSPHLARLLPGAHGLQQALHLRRVLHRLPVSVTEEVLQRPLLPLQTLAQLLRDLALARSQFAEQSCTEILRRRKECKF